VSANIKSNRRCLIALPLFGIANDFGDAWHPNISDARPVRHPVDDARIIVLMIDDLRDEPAADERADMTLRRIS